MSNQPNIFAGIGLTLLLHIFVAGIAVSKTGGMGGCAASSEGKGDLEESQVIQASLAFKEVKPKNKQPQKEKKKKFKPRTDDAASKDEKLTPKDEDKKEKPPVEKDEIDTESVFDKNRKQEEELSTHGADEVPVEGEATGSKDWGTAKEAKGHPYMGELVGRLKVEVPTLETGTGLAKACIRLDSDGKIIDRQLVKSKNINLDRAVEVGLDAATDMEDPVPDELLQLLTVNGICIPFKL